MLRTEPDTAVTPAAARPIARPAVALDYARPAPPRADRWRGRFWVAVFIMLLPTLVLAAVVAMILLRW